MNVVDDIDMIFFLLYSKNHLVEESRGNRFCPCHSEKDRKKKTH